MRVAHRILKNAGCAPAWVEQGKRIRLLLLREARGELEDVWIDQLASSAFMRRHLQREKSRRSSSKPTRPPMGGRGAFLH